MIKVEDKVYNEQDGTKVYCELNEIGMAKFHVSFKCNINPVNLWVDVKGSLEKAQKLTELICNNMASLSKDIDNIKGA